jgi:hypothetical protein
MALLSEITTGRAIPLQPEHVVGRAPTCPLRLDPRYVSGQHAVLRWTGGRWEVKDLSSRNGTFVSGARIEPGLAEVVRKGTRIAFGKAEEEWELADDAPPGAMAVPLGEGEPVLMDGDLLALPSSDDPRVTIYRDITGAWVIEQPDESVSIIRDGQIFECAGHWWRFSCAGDTLTTGLDSPSEMRVQQIHLSFAVSQNEEYVELEINHNGRTIPIPVRARNYLLLTLARRRLEDARNGVPDAACGWICQDESPHDASMAPPQLNLDVYRLRKQFEAVGVVDPANIIERRPLTRELRIGTARLSISAL